MLETSTADDVDPLSSVSLLESFLSLDTIQETKENSSLSGESAEESDVTLTVSTCDLQNQTEEGENLDKPKTKVKWIHEEEEEEEEEGGKEEEENSEEYFYEIRHPDVDGGWAWVVSVAVFLMFAINAGLLSCTGLYYVQMLEEFGRSRSYTAWLGSLMNAFFMLAGPICSALIKQAGCRVSVMLGGIIMTSGYLMSAISHSLPTIFLTYGIVVATGMNFVYSGQIITLAQYFNRRHSLATSASMIGVGVGMFFMVRVIDYAIVEYGWRTSFVFCAGFSLQLCVLGAMVFPMTEKEIQSSSKEEKLKSAHEENVPMYSPAFSERMMHINKYSLNRSVSSLKLSIGAGYLSSSFSNLNADNISGHAYVGSNQHSFCSRGSQYLGDVRSNQGSFLQMHHGEFPLGLLPFLKSNQHSFSSRDSFGIYSLKSNTYSSSNKNSQLDLHHAGYHHCVPLVKYLETGQETSNYEEKIVGRKDAGTGNPNNPSKTILLSMKLKEAVRRLVCECHLELFLDPCFWCVNISMFFTMLATIKLFIIYKDLSGALGVVHYYYHAMSAFGIGDILGRISLGVISAYRSFNFVPIYALNIFLTGIVIGCHIFATNGAIFILVSALFGFLYGQQCVLITFIIAPLFGKEVLVTVFGYILFVCGLGALVGAPLAGAIVDCTGSYNGVILLSVCSCIIGGISMFGCYKISQKRQRKRKELSKFII